MVFTIWTSQQQGGEGVEKIIRKTIDEYTTYELIEELYRREGVEKHIAEPYKDVNVEVNGPAIILIVID